MCGAFSGDRNYNSILMISQTTFVNHYSSLWRHFDLYHFWNLDRKFLNVSRNKLSHERLLPPISFVQTKEGKKEKKKANSPTGKYFYSLITSLTYFTKLVHFKDSVQRENKRHWYYLYDCLNLVASAYSFWLHFNNYYIGVTIVDTLGKGRIIYSFFIPMQAL